MSKNNIENTIPENFNVWVKKSISLIGSLGKLMDNESTTAFLISHDIPEQEALEIVLFLPIAFTRKLLPHVKWPARYIELDTNNNQIKKLFSENPRYLIIENETALYWEFSPKKEIILNVAGRSAEFKAINDLLLKNGGNLENVKIHETIIHRPNC